MQLVLSQREGVPVVEIPDAKGEVVDYRYRVKAGRKSWVVTLTALNQHGEPALARDGSERRHVVTLLPRGCWCSCPDYRMRRRAIGEECKHVRHARELKRIWDDLTGGTEHERDD